MKGSFTLNLQVEVSQQHQNDKDRARKFINTTWPDPDQTELPDQDTGEEPVNMENHVTYAVLTTKESSLLLVAAGLQTMFTRNTASVNTDNPWLIFQYRMDKPKLANHIRDEWKQRVEKSKSDIAPYLVYEMPRDEPRKVELLNFEFDVNGRVRVVCRDTTLWSHPPRDAQSQAQPQQV